MMKFIKKPIVIDAVQWNVSKESFDAILELGNVQWEPGHIGANGFYIKTHEGQRFVFNGDWVIKDAHGEFHICKPDIFEQTYEIIDHEVLKTMHDES